LSVGLGFLHQVLIDRPCLDFLNNFGLKVEDFDEREQEVIEIIKNHILIYSVLPSKETVEAEWGTQFSKFPREPIDYWTDGIIRRSANMLISESFDAVKRHISNNDVDEAQARIKKLYLELQERRGAPPAVNLADLGKLVLEEHDKAQVSRHDAVISLGFPYLDKVSAGAHPGDFIAIVGKRSAGKTYIMLKMANAIHAAGKVPMVISTEMSPVQYARRILALRSGIKFSAIRTGRLIHHIGRSMIETDIQTLLECKNPYLVMKSALTTTLEDVILHVKEKRPDCVYVDGAYLLRSEYSKRLNRFEQYSHGADMLKLLAQDTGIPVIASYQLRRKTAGGLDDVYMSDVIAQNATLVIGISDVEEEHKNEAGWESVKYKIIEILKGREGETGKILVYFDMERTKIEEVEVLSESSGR